MPSAMTATAIPSRRAGYDPLEALALARAEGVAVSLADDGAHICYRSRGKALAARRCAVTIGESH
jgi:hypothetical protein